jgi:hypothetical protein
VNAIDRADVHALSVNFTQTFFGNDVRHDCLLEVAFHSFSFERNWFSPKALKATIV